MEYLWEYRAHYALFFIAPWSGQCKLATGTRFCKKYPRVKVRLSVKGWTWKRTRVLGAALAATTLPEP